MKRESNYDLLRILSTFSVIVLHVSGWFLAYNDAQSPTNCHFVMMQFNHIVRFAVPSFLMLSGAFLLADERNADYKYFYKKSIRNIGLTGAVFCLLYALYRILIVTMGTFVLHRHGTDTVWPRLTLVFYELFTGRPFYHLWYMTTLTGLYLAVPFAIRLAVNLQRGGVDLYGKITPAFLALASVSYFTSEHVLTWDIGWQFCYLSYFLMGYKIRRWAADKKSNLIAALLIMAGCAINILLGVINYHRGLQGLPVDVLFYRKNMFSYAPLAPIEVIASCLIFAGFSAMKTSRNYSKLAGYTFLIYLFHAGVWEVVSSIIRERLIGNQTVEAVAAIVISIFVFFISLLAAKIYKQSHFENRLISFVKKYIFKNAIDQTKTMTKSS